MISFCTVTCKSPKMLGHAIHGLLAAGNQIKLAYRSFTCSIYIFQFWLYQAFSLEDRCSSTLFKCATPPTKVLSAYDNRMK